MAQKYQELVEEDLNVGTGTCWVTAPTSGQFRSTQIGLHSFARGQKEYTATWAPGAIAAGRKASTTVTVPDAAVADFVIASHDQMLTDSLRIAGHVSAANTAKVVIHNPTASSVTVASGTVSVLVFPVIAQTPTVMTSISGVLSCSGSGTLIEGSTITLYLYTLIEGNCVLTEIDTDVTGADGAFAFSFSDVVDDGTCIGGPETGVYSYLLTASATGSSGEGQESGTGNIGEATVQNISVTCGA